MKTPKANYESSNYRYALEILDKYHENDIEKTNYAEVLLSMSKASTIEACMSIYDRVYKKYSRDIPHYYENEEKAFVNIINLCLNDNIVRCIESQKENLTSFLCLKALANIRPSSKYQEKQNKVLEAAKQKGVSLSEEKTKTIIETVRDFNDNYTDIRNHKFAENTNGYRRVKNEYFANLEILGRFGFILSAYEKEYKISKYKPESIVLAVICIILIILTFVFGFEKIIGFLGAIGIIFYVLTLKR